MNLLISLILPLALLVAGGYMFVKAGSAVRQIDASQSWPSVAGQVVRHHDDPSTSGARTHRAFYTYTVGGQTYDGNVYFIASRMTGKPELDQFWSRYAIGAAVTVYYDPSKPQECLLVREQGTNWFFFGFSVVVLGAGVWFLIKVFFP